MTQQRILFRHPKMLVDRDLDNGLKEALADVKAGRMNKPFSGDRRATLAGYPALTQLAKVEISVK